MTSPTSTQEAPPPSDDKQDPQIGPIVTVYVDDKPVEIHRGNQTIAAIKQAAGVALVDQLQLETSDGLQKLDQNGSIALKGDERFQSFPATGKSS